VIIGQGGKKPRWLHFVAGDAHLTIDRIIVLFKKGELQRESVEYK
jgi:hypothetical protein